MNDDKLTNELRRRADSSSGGTDWAKHTLLPAVRRGIDARPQPVLTSTWSPRLGLVAVVAALVVLVVAVPRLTPGSRGLSATDRAGDFTLTLTAGRGQYATGEAIDVAASLTYSGIESPITVKADKAGLLQFGMRELDGPLNSGPVHLGICDSYEVSRDVPVVAAFTKSGGFGSTDADAGFYRSWFGDPTFRLPVGTYEISAEVALGCQDPGPTLHASLQISVVAAEPERPPDASELAVMTQEAFAAEVLAGGLRGSTVLVQGRITADPARVEYCIPTQYCYFGDMAGLDRSLLVRDVATVQDDSNATMRGIASWLYWRVFRGPVEGLLVLAVNETGQVEYLGRLALAEPTLGVRPATVKSIDPVSLSLDEVVIVEGWLRGLVGHFECPVADAADPTIRGLPQRYCGNDGWVADVPHGFNRDGLRVQNSAYIQFAKEPSPAADGSGVEPRWGRYVVARRLEGWCGTAQAPCWLWTVVARIDANPVVIPTSALAPSPTPGPSPPAPNVLECPQPIAEMPPAIRVIDHAEIVVSCEGETDRSVATGDLTVSTEGGGTLVVTWPVVLDNCTPMQSVLELWRDPRSEGNYSLAVRMSNPNAEPADPGEPICDAATGVHKARIMLSQNVSPTAIHAFQTIESATSVRGSAMATADGVEFELAVSATKSTYSVGEAVEVSASLASSTDLTVSCLMSPIISLEQLDGPITFQPGPFVLMCAGPTDLRSATPVTNGFLPAVWALSEPHPLGPYIRDGKLYLPEGTYRFNATSSFSMGGLSSGARVQLDTSMVISVGGGFMVSPPILHTPSPTASPNLTVRERIDLYWYEVGSVECLGMLGPESVAEVASWSDLIVVGRPISAEPVSDSPNPEALIQFEVHEVLKGDLPQEPPSEIRVNVRGVPLGNLSEIDHLLLLNASRSDSTLATLAASFMSIYANVDGRVVTPEFAEIKREYGISIFSVGLDGTSFDDLVKRVRNLPGSAQQRDWLSVPGGYFAC